MFLYRYLPEKLIPNDLEELDFDEFFALFAVAQAARELKIEDIKIGVNQGIAAALGDN